MDSIDCIVYKNEINTKGKLGIEKNKIVEIKNFIDKDTSEGIIKYFEYQSDIWGDIAFYESYGMGLSPDDENLLKFNIPKDTFKVLSERFKNSVEKVFNKKLKPNTSHGQKWNVGGFAAPHSDNSDFDGNPNAFQINKYVAILYLNDNYGGGELYFPDHNLEIKPHALSLIMFPGGVENIHGVKEITSGVRYTIVSFWDFIESEYSEEIRSQWEEEIEKIRKIQEHQRKEWAKGNKFA